MRKWQRSALGISLTRGRLNFGLGFGTESDNEATFGLVSVSVGRTVMSFGFGQNYECIWHQNRKWSNAGCLLWLCLLSVVLYSLTLVHVTCSAVLSADNCASSLKHD